MSRFPIQTLPRYGSYFEPVLPTKFKKSDAGTGKLNKIVFSEVSTIYMIFSNFLLHKIKKMFLGNKKPHFQILIFKASFSWKLLVHVQEENKSLSTL
jgi:hypothetical protein